MTEEITNEALDEILGTPVSTIDNFRILTIDNGSDIAGTGATGKFMYRVKKGDVMEKVLYADSFVGVILASRAQLTDSSKKQTWRTGEFDSLNINFIVSVYKIDPSTGKTLKDASNNVIVSKNTYQEIKDARRIQQPDGTFKSTYNYFQILYILVENDILNFQFKCAGRGNFFDYSKSISRMGAKL
jgi:hypothetical protein